MPWGLANPTPRESLVATRQRLAQPALVDQPRGAGSGDDRQLGIRVGASPELGHHERMPLSVEAHDAETRPRLVPPHRLRAPSKVDAIDLVRQRADGSTGVDRTGVGGIHELGPDDAAAGAADRI